MDVCGAEDTLYYPEALLDLGPDLGFGPVLGLLRIIVRIPCDVAQDSDVMLPTEDLCCLDFPLLFLIGVIKYSGYVARAFYAGFRR